MPEPSPNEPHQLRPLLQHERHRDEPAVGGRGFEEAVSEWGRFTAQDQAEWETDSPEKFFGDTYDHFLFLTKTSDLLERIWPAEKVICFATPVLRRRKTGRRILHAEEVSERLFLSGDCAFKGKSFTRVAFVRLRFYRIGAHPELFAPDAANKNAASATAPCSNPATIELATEADGSRGSGTSTNQEAIPSAVATPRTLRGRTRRVDPWLAVGVTSDPLRREIKKAVWLAATDGTVTWDAKESEFLRNWAVEQITKGARRLYELVQKPNTGQAEQMLCDALSGASRKRIRPVLQRAEFKNQRRGPGERRDQAPH